MITTPEKALKKYFGYSKFRPGQAEIIATILSGKSTLNILPTGAGKSLCYQIPALISPGFSIVISPLIALMKDQVDALNKNENLAEFINSTMSYREADEVFRKLELGRVKLLYVAPERLENTGFAERIVQMKPEFLFIDEAHCISEWGHNFRPSYTRIKDFIAFSGIKKISAFTATATPEVVRDITVQLDLKHPEIFVRGFERDNISVSVQVTKKKKEQCLQLLRIYGGPAIIYTSSRKKAEEAAEYLLMHKVNASYYHAGLPPEVRKKIQEEFINDELNVIAATNAFGMGIDKKNIRLIIHYNMPGTIENYYQEIGRAGRDGKESHAFLLYDDSDINIHNFFLANSHPDKELIMNVYNAICDFGRVAVGSSRTAEIPVNQDYISAYCRKEISRGLLYSALGILEKSDYIKMQSQFEKKDTVQIITDKESLRKLISNSRSDIIKDLVLFLLREYGSIIFSKPVSLSFSKISDELGYPEEETDEALVLLENLGYLSVERALKKDHVYLNGMRIDAAAIRIDYKKLNEQYLNQQRKLDKMVEFVFTKDCRFAFILKYFGENLTDYKCGKCDICSEGQGVTDSVMEYISELILKTIGEIGGTANPDTVVKILRGTMPGREYRKLSTFGSCSNHNSNDLKSILKILISRNILKKEQGSSKNVVIGEKGYPILRTALPEVSDDNSYADYQSNLILFNSLRDARTEASKKYMQTAYLICPDSVLRDIAEKRPQSRAEILKIKGFTERTFNKVGERFLEIIRIMGNNDPKNVNNVSKKELPSNLTETYSLLKKKYPLKDIASLRKLSEAVVSMQIESILEFDPSVDVSYLVGQELFDKISEYLSEGSYTLKELKEFAGGAAGYPLIRIAAAKFRAVRSVSDSQDN